jgi:hypothetical protein
MYTFILIVDSSAKPKCVSDFLRGLGEIKQQAGERRLVAGPNGMKDGWIAITPQDDVVTDFDADELAKVTAKISDPSYFVVEGRDTTTSFANDFVLSLDNSLNAMIDNDHGCIATVSHFKNLVRAGKDWLYCSE